MLLVGTAKPPKSLPNLKKRNNRNEQIFHEFYAAAAATTTTTTIQSAVSPTTRPQPLPKPVLHIVRSGASYSSYGHPLAAYVFFLIFPSLLPSF